MKIHVGIDVSKRKFDLTIHENTIHRVFEMNAKEISECTSFLKKHNTTLVVMEATGGYEHELFMALVDAGLDVAVVNPRQTRDFAKACGKLAKTDKIDSSVIAHYAAMFDPKPTAKPSEITLKIKAITARRRQLVGMITSEKNRLHQVRDSFVKETIVAVIDAMNKQLALLDQQVSDAIDASPELQNKTEILRSVPGIGSATAFQLITDLPELGSISRRGLGQLSGTAPRNRDSGDMRGKRTTGGGRKTIRATLYMPTLTATRFNPVIKKHYEQLLARGKTKMVAIVACMRKLLTILNALVAKNEKWNPKIT